MEAVPAWLAVTRKTYRRNLGPQSKWVNRTNFLRSQPSLRRLSNEALGASEDHYSRPFRLRKDAFCWSDQPFRASGPPVFTARCAGCWWSAPPLDAPPDTPDPGKPWLSRGVLSGKRPWMTFPRTVRRARKKPGRRREDRLTAVARLRAGDPWRTACGCSRRRRAFPRRLCGGSPRWQ